ncbi:MAG: hypothetical protein ABI068_09485 [Ktedonobacterales bacterium]
MVYQVMIRRQSGAHWEPFETTTNDPFAAMRLIQQANQRHPEVTVLQAPNAQALSALLRRLRAGIEPPAGSSPTPGISATPRMRVMDDRIEVQRWAMERGAGGDHDAPYRFTMPTTRAELARWLSLLTRWQQAPAATDGEGGDTTGDEQDNDTLPSVEADQQAS